MTRTSYANVALRNPYKQYSFVPDFISNNDRAFINATAKIAFTSEYRFRMAALLVKSGRVLRGDTNTPRITPHTPPDRVSTHAEIRVIKNSRSTKGSTIYIARLLSDDSTALSKPCVWCLEHIINSGIYRVVFTTNNDEPLSFLTSSVKWLE
jgi:tRNA(Arg) A34 adenosine deaminase TadA